MEVIISMSYAHLFPIQVAEREEHRSSWHLGGPGLNPLMEAPGGAGLIAPGIRLFPPQQLSLRAFNKSDNKINFYSKCVGSTSSIVPPDSLPHPLDQYIRVIQLDSFKYINSGFLEPVLRVKSDFQDIWGRLSLEYHFTDPNY